MAGVPFAEDRMKAAVLTKLNAPLEIADVEPLPPDVGQVAVRMTATGICGAQLAEIRGDKGNAKFLPHLLGHEGCGIVEGVGLGVTKVRRGDKVVLHWRKGSGIESEFPRYRYAGRIISSGKVVTFAEHVVVSENRVTPVPAQMEDNLCALLGCGLSTALATLQHEANFAAGQSLLVIGAGGLGLNLLAAARLFHAEPVACLDLNVGKQRMVERLGASFWALPEIGSRFDVVVDTVGNSGTMATGLRHLAPGGQLILVGHPTGDVTIPGAGLFAGEGQRIKATQGGGFAPDRDVPRWVRLWQTGKLRAQDTITHSLPFAQINEGIDLVRNCQAGRVFLTFDA
jgi:S-(hydroxymethyl)glutathione dehydrogenase/alcohol dehydrogenase